MRTRQRKETERHRGERDRYRDRKAERHRGETEATYSQQVNAPKVGEANLW